MVDRLIRLQLIAFVVVSVLGVGYASTQYLEIPRLLGLGSYTVTLDLPATGGLYENALVTYRGVRVGKVNSLEVSRDDVRAVLGIDNGVSIPSDSTVSLRSTSAIGENYVDFEPRAHSAPMHAGQVIPGDKVIMPTPVGDFLESWNRFAATLPLDKLNSTVVEAHKALDGTGPYLANFLSSARQLQDLADANLDPTVRLVRDLVPVLATQQRIGPDVRSFTGDLAGVTDTLRTSDANIRGVIDKVPPFANQVDSLFNQLSPTLPQLLTDLTSTGQVLRVYIPHINHTLTVFPVTMANLLSVSQASAPLYNTTPAPVAGVNFKMTVNDPPPCFTGYEAKRNEPNDLSNSHPPAVNSWCREPKNSPVGVRSLQKTPCPPGSPAGVGSTGATAAECGWNFQTPQQAAAATAAAIRYQLEVAARNPKTRAENDALIGKDRPPRPPMGPQPPAINDPWGPAQQDPNGSFLAGGQQFVNGNAVPPPRPSIPGAPTGLEQYLLGPLMSRS